MILRSALRSYASELVGAGTEYKVVPANTEAGGSATSAGQESVLKMGVPHQDGLTERLTRSRERPRHAPRPPFVRPTSSILTVFELP